VVLRVVEQERVVAVRRLDLRRGDVVPVVDQRLDEMTRNLQRAGASARARSPPVSRAGSK
jgi:hypothetical protein